ncbi:GcvT family protein [Phytohabitans houttuyneae]|uniref:FAD-dependent oxidoreductase n=1 Tax=Phytohabitans houttuyneae TaxID=1076126 RepID=A0A6V8JYZ1_9ACTN|nr:FAD-dependent oxidoreductase [Phytohabitans houttuyneae]GFJ77982.1 FAD-dependent oxidoreductase [Phytohabitans houttuyneae]
MRTEARVVVVGGGVAGCSVAYHLARLGWTDVVVLEQHELTEGTTWHSAGFVGQLRSTVSQTRMIMYSSSLYAELRERTGLDPGWRGVGGLRLATTPEREQELLRQVSAATTYGLEMELLSPAQALSLLPMLDVSDVRSAGWLPGDGYLRPEPLAAALAAGAHQLGVGFHTGVRVTGVEVERGRVRAVQTDKGRIATDVVVDAAGAAAGHVGRLAGVAIPIVPIKHQYVVSSSLDGADLPGIPTVRDPDHIVYFRGEGDGLLVGGYIRTPEVCWPEDGSPPLATARTLFPPDLAKFEESWANAGRRVPALRAARIDRVVHGPEAFTPDGEFLLGETAVGGFWVAAGFCVHGLAAAGGVGKVLAEWIVDGQPEFDVSHMDIRRFGGHAASRSWATAKALDAYSRYYDVVYPYTEWSAGRPLRRSATWPRLEPLGAALGEKAGWERVNWFAPPPAFVPSAPRPTGWAGQVWSPAIEAECRATAEAAGLFDQSSFAKLDVHGPASFLQRMCAADVDRPVGTVVYTQLLNARAGIEADLTVTRLGETHFRIVTSTASGVRDLAWLRRHAPDGVSVEDVTGGYGCLCLWGPAARDILQPLVDEALDFRFMRARRLTIGPVPVLAQRVTFVGEFGWELYTPTEYTLTLWDLLLSTGGPSGLTPAGYRAIDAMRLEKGYRVWGSDITPETTPDEAGLGFAVRTETDFLGRDALLAARAAGGPDRRLRCLVLDDPRTVCLGTEPVRVDGRPCGRVTSGGYGYRVGASIAYAYLPSTVDVGTKVEVGVFGSWQSAEVRSDPLYDPRNTRVRGVR